MRTRNAEYLQICKALQDLQELKSALQSYVMMPNIQALTKRLGEPILCLMDRKLLVSPTSGKNRPSPR